MIKHLLFVYVELVSMKRVINVQVVLWDVRHVHLHLCVRLVMMAYKLKVVYVNVYNLSHLQIQMVHVSYVKIHYHSVLIVQMLKYVQYVMLTQIDNLISKANVCVDQVISKMMLNCANYVLSQAADSVNQPKYVTSVISYHIGNMIQIQINAVV